VVETIGPIEANGFKKLGCNSKFQPCWE
jgi:hypothetical protein